MDDNEDWLEQLNDSLNYDDLENLLEDIEEIEDDSAVEEPAEVEVTDTEPQDSDENHESNRKSFFSGLKGLAKKKKTKETDALDSGDDDAPQRGSAQGEEKAEKGKKDKKPKKEKKEKEKKEKVKKEKKGKKSKEEEKPEEPVEPPKEETSADLEDEYSILADMQRLGLDIEAELHGGEAAKEEADKEEKGKKKKEKKPKKEKQKKELTPEEIEKKRLKEEAKQKRREEDFADMVPVSILGVLLCVTVAAALICFVYFGSTIFSYNRKLSEARSCFAEKNYRDAYEFVEGMEVKDADQDFYQQLVNIMKVERYRQEFQSMYRLQIYDGALNSLLQGVNQYQLQISEQGMTEQMAPVAEIYGEILERLSTYYEISETDAKKAIAYGDVEYRDFVRDCSKKVKIVENS